MFRYDDVVRISRDTESFINGGGTRPNIRPNPAMICQDGEQHRKQRALVSAGFTPRGTRRIERRAREIVRSLVNEMLEKTVVDIVEDLAAPLPMQLIADMLDIAEGRRTAVGSWIRHLAKGGCGPDYVDREVEEAFGRFCLHHTQMVQERIRAGCQGEDLLTICVGAEIDGAKLSASQLLFEHLLLNTGGAGTTRGTIAGGLYELSKAPEQYDALHEDPTCIPNAVEEIIRFVCPLSFGHGPHFCLGASMAHLEVRLVLEEVTKRIARIRPLPGHPLEQVSSSFTRGPARFPAIVEARGLPDA